jgi:adenosylcobinamide kinase/adenosylcobinamide-phosphate guanylyltransferase
VNRKTLILGGARSGKTAFAEAQAKSFKGKRAYIATAEAFDDEMRSRIDRHQSDRGDGWRTIEAPLDLVTALSACEEEIIVVDCITVWLGNLMHHGRDCSTEVASLCAVLAGKKQRVLIVSNEVGLGIVPENAMTRQFRDHQGFANQKIAAIADEVIFVAAGLPLILKKAKSPKAPRRRG